MYPINFTTCTAQDVIRRSLVCHPTAFADRLFDTAEMHARYASATYDNNAAKAAWRLAEACRNAAGIVVSPQSDDDKISAIATLVSLLVPTLQCAFDLQCVPRDCRADILTRSI